jgi:hypothetical protein
MFSIKVEFTGGDKVYKFKDGQEVLIGKGDNCQVKLEIDGISRQHMKIYSRNGDYFCQDLGSTNGSFINDDKLEPNTEVAFTSFFPIRLGFDVFVNLLDDVDPSDMLKFPDPAIPAKAKEPTSSKNQDSAKKFSNSTQSNKIEVVSNKPRAKRAVKEVPTKAMNSSTKRNFIIILMGVSAYIYFTMIHKTEEPVVAEAPVAVEKPVEKTPAPLVKAKPKAFELTAEDEILIKNSVAMQKCLASDEQDLCNKFKLMRERNYPEGVLIKPTAIIYVFNAIKSLEIFRNKYKYTKAEAKELTDYALKSLGPDARKLNFKMTYNLKPVPDEKVPKILAVFEFLYSGAILIDPKVYQDKSIMFVPVTEENGQYRVVGFFKPNMERLRKMQMKDLHRATKYAGITGLFKDFDDYFP